MPNPFFGNRDKKNANDNANKNTSANINAVGAENTLSSNEKTPDEKILKIKQLISDYDNALSQGEKLISPAPEPKRQKPKEW